MISSRKFASFKEAVAYCEERGQLEYFGAIGQDPEYFVYHLHLHSGGSYSINIYDTGLLEVKRYVVR